ncbi:MAG: hypothetical protein HWD60_18720 [Defluviicoccus sp.]|nr:MAG: hypothetical protein HWD60_18720 [Defluviicoccus sp.]
MAYSPNDLSVLAYSNGFTLWHYTTTDAAATVDTAGYFNAASDMVRVGDMVFANCTTAGTAEAGIFLVRANTAGVVDVANLTPVGASNTD